MGDNLSLKKPALLLICVLVGAFFAGCGNNKTETSSFEGTELVVNLREKYSALNSAKIEIYDVTNDAQYMDFAFKLDENGTMHYLTKSGESWEYNDGKKSVVCDGANISEHSGLFDAAFRKYTAQKRHSNADKGIFFYEPTMLDTEISSYTEEKDGIKRVTLCYDSEKIAAQLSGNYKEIRSFVTDYTFDSDGNFIELTETTTYEDSEYKLRVTLSDENAVTEISQPEVEK